MTDPTPPTDSELSPAHAESVVIPLQIEAGEDGELVADEVYGVILERLQDCGETALLERIKRAQR